MGQAKDDGRDEQRQPFVLKAALQLILDDTAKQQLFWQGGEQVAQRPGEYPGEGIERGHAEDEKAGEQADGNANEGVGGEAVEDLFAVIAVEFECVADAGQRPYHQVQQQNEHNGR